MSENNQGSKPKFPSKEWFGVSKNRNMFIGICCAAVIFIVIAILGASGVFGDLGGDDDTPANPKGLTIEFGEKIDNIVVDNVGKEYELTIQDDALIDFYFSLNNDTQYTFTLKNKTTQATYIQIDSPFSKENASCYLLAGDYIASIKSNNNNKTTDVTLYVVKPTISAVTFGQTIAIEGKAQQDAWYSWRSFTLSESKQIMLNAENIEGSKMGLIAVYKRNDDGTLNRLAHTMSSQSQANNRTPHYTNLSAGTYYVCLSLPESADAKINYSVIDLASYATEITFDNGVFTTDLTFVKDNNTVSDYWFKLVLDTETHLELSITADSFDPFLGAYADLYPMTSSETTDKVANVYAGRSGSNKPTSIIILNAGTYYLRASAILHSSADSEESFSLNISEN